MTRTRAIVVGLFLLLSMPVVVHAQAIVGEAMGVLNEVRGDTGVTKTDIPTVVGEAIQAVLSLVGLFFLVLMIYAGLKWMLARGVEEHIQKAQKTVIAASIGLVITVSGYAFTLLVAEGLITPQTDSNSTEGPVALDPNAPHGCCMVRTAAADSSGTGGWSFDQIGFSYDNGWVDTESACLGFQPTDGVVVLIGPIWVELPYQDETPEDKQKTCNTITEGAL